MKNPLLVLLLVNVLVLCGGIYIVKTKKSAQPVDNAPVIVQPQENQLKNPSELPKINYKITKPQPSFQQYPAIVEQLKQWNSEAPALTEVGTYGKSAKGKDLYYIRIFNKKYANIAEKPRVMITACIHGNEPLSASTTMWYIGTILDKYGDDPEITELVDSRDIYFVPVVSPDSYPSSRHVDGVDPNRDFPGPTNPTRKSTPAVAAVQDLFLKIKPRAVISGHTWGRVYLIPYGDKMQNCPDHTHYERIVGQMAKTSGYRWIRACDMYSAKGGLNVAPIRRSLGVRQYAFETSIPIHGSEVDWYYRNGAMAIVCEFGEHQRVPSDADTRTEFDKTFRAMLHFVKEAPIVQLSPSR